MSSRRAKDKVVLEGSLRQQTRRNSAHQKRGGEKPIRSSKNHQQESQKLATTNLEFGPIQEDEFTKDNPNNKLSNTRGWQAMALCIGTILPSFEFRPFLESHLEKVARTSIGQVDEALIQGMSTPSIAAVYCLKRLRGLNEVGERKLPPNYEEMHAIETMTTVELQVYLPNGSSEAVHDVINGVYFLDKYDAIMVGAFQLRACGQFPQLLEDTFSTTASKDFGPKIYVKKNLKGWRDSLLRTVAKLPNEDNLSICRYEYVEFLRIQCPLYGASWFYVEQKGDARFPDEMFLAIHPNGVYIVEVLTKDHILEVKYTEICSWAYSKSYFSLVTGNLSSLRRYISWILPSPSEKVA